MPDNDPVDYRSNVRIERNRGAIRKSYIPDETEPIWFSVHSEVAEHYGVEPGTLPVHATTLDYVVSAAAG